MKPISVNVSEEDKELLAGGEGVSANLRKAIDLWKKYIEGNKELESLEVEINSRRMALRKLSQEYEELGQEIDALENKKKMRNSLIAVDIVENRKVTDSWKKEVLGLLNKITISRNMAYMQVEDADHLAQITRDMGIYLLMLSPGYCYLTKYGYDQVLKLDFRAIAETQKYFASLIFTGKIEEEEQRKILEIGNHYIMTLKSIENAELELIRKNNEFESFIKEKWNPSIREYNNLLKEIRSLESKISDLKNNDILAQEKRISELENELMNKNRIIENIKEMLSDRKLKKLGLISNDYDLYERRF